MKYLLAIEASDFSVKAMLVDKNGEVVYSTQKSLKPLHPFHGHIELDPEEIFTTVKEVVLDLVDQSEIDIFSIQGLGVTSACGTVIVWDKETKKPLWNAILAGDNRTRAICHSLKDHQSTIHEKTGAPLSTYGPATKLRWILDNAKNVNLENCLFGGLNTYLLWRLTDSKVFITDMSSAAKSLLFNIHLQTWDDDLIKIFGVVKWMLPEIRSCNEIYGFVDEGLFGVKTPICSSVSAVGGAMFAADCHKMGDVHLLAGASAFLVMNVGNSPIKSTNSLVSTVAFSLKNRPATFCLEAMTPSAGSVIEWLESHLGIIRSAKEVEGLAYSVPDSGGVYFVPAITGLNFSLDKSRVQASLLGLSPSTNIGHICRACLEGIAFLIRDGFELYKQNSNAHSNKITCSGGMSENVFFLQITADLMGETIVRPKEIQLSLLGAAYLAGLTLGIWKSQEQIQTLFSFDRAFKPSLEEKDKIVMIRDWKKAVKSALVFNDIVD